MAHIELISVAENKSTDGMLSRFPYAYPIIARGLSKTDHTFNIVDTHLHHKTFNDLLKHIDESQTHIFGISAWSHHYLMVKALTAHIRAKHGPRAVIILGGIITGNDDVLVTRTETDIAVTAAEGEHVLPEVLDCLERDWQGMDKVLGLTYRDRRTGDIIKTGRRPVMNNEQFNNQDWPLYEYFDKELQQITNNINQRTDVPVPGFPLLSSRGCPFKCTFCGHLYGRRFLRKQWDTLFDQLGFLMKRYGARGFYSFDTNLFLTERHVDDYCETYARRGLDFTMVAELRATFGDVAMFRRLYDHGVRVVIFGFESGSQEMLDRMKKGSNTEKMYQVVSAAFEAGMMVYGNFIFGTPGERPKTVRETRRYMLRLERLLHAQELECRRDNKLFTSNYLWSVLVPSPTSELYALARRHGLIEDEENYLIGLSDKKYYGEGVNGFTIRIDSLLKGATNVNLSEFTSKDALLHYVNYSCALVKLQADLFTVERARNNLGRIARNARLIVRHYTAYAALTLLDRLHGRRGFFPHESAADGAGPTLVPAAPAGSCSD